MSLIYKKNKRLETMILSILDLNPKFIDLGLERIQKLLLKLDSPEKKLPPVIHIAGTNGKGSTLIFIKKIMEECGLKIHCYTSPHLINFNERIVISNLQIKNEYLHEILKEVLFINKDEKITFFELTTAAAILAFSRIPADYCLVETGLGGRLDATNIIKFKILNIITSIGRDHEEFLSPFLKNIVYEKCGILSKDIPVIISKQNSNYKNKLLNEQINLTKCKKINLLNSPKNYKLGLLGDHQYINAKTAVTATKYILKKVDNTKIKNGLEKASWPGRIQEISNFYFKTKRLNKTFIDGAHNVEGAIIINNYLNKLNLGKWHFIVGMMNTKNPKKFVNIFERHIEKIVFIPISNQNNCYSPNLLCKEFLNKKYQVQYDLNLQKAMLKVPRNKPLFVTGSLYLMGEFLKIYSKNDLAF